MTNQQQPIAMHVPEAVDIAEARTIVLRQVDSLADWLFVECKGSTQIKARPVLRDMTPEDFARWPVAWLVALTMDLGQPQATRCAASEAIGERYLADDDVQAEVIRVANRLMQDRLSDDRRDERERRADFARRMDAPALALESSQA